MAMHKRDRLRILIAGGGTGGHLYPALAIAEGLRQAVERCDIRFVGSRYGLEARILKQHNEVFYPLNIRGIQRSLGPAALGRNLLLPWRLASSQLRCRRLLRDFRPQVAVGTGGYAAGIPLRAAQRRGIPTLIQEQNSYPGFTTRRLAARADVVCLTYASSAQYLNTQHDVLTGNPVRFNGDGPSREAAREQLRLPPRRQVLFLLGGSQGSRPLNRHFRARWETYTAGMGVHLLWQTGPRDYDQLARAVGASDRVTLVPFITDMAAAYAASDLVVCRAGATTLSELAYLGRPAILVPLPSAAGDHQTKNALTMVARKAARMVPQADLKSGALEEAVRKLVRYPDRLRAMGKRARAMARPDATRLIVEHVLRLAAA